MKVKLTHYISIYIFFPGVVALSQVCMHVTLHSAACAVIHGHILLFRPLEGRRCIHSDAPIHV